MKNRSIKIEILINFFTAIILATIIIGTIMLSVMLFLHIINSRLYFQFIELYNNDINFVFKFLLIVFSTFIILMIYIFFYRMNGITNYINNISNTVNEIARGNLNVKLIKKYDNELGGLASNINTMTDGIKELMDKEREWEINKMRLITNLSHDLRTPLTSVIGFIELIKNRKYKNEIEFNHYCEIAFNKSNELKKSLEQLFEFSKLNNGDIKINKILIDVKELIGQIIIGFTPIFDENNMECRIFVGEQSTYIEGDPLLLVRVFENIINNAIKYGSSGKYLDINIKIQESKVAISFVNYGDIIKEDDLEKIFERLYRVEKQSNKKEGTGLGLAIGKTIIELHGGEILVTSYKEKTEFKVIIPM